MSLYAKLKSPNKRQSKRKIELLQTPNTKPNTRMVILATIILPFSSFAKIIIMINNKCYVLTTFLFSSMKLHVKKVSIKWIINAFSEYSRIEGHR